MSAALLEPIDLVIVPPRRILREPDYRHWWQPQECDLQWTFETWLAVNRPELDVRREFPLGPGQRPDFLAWYELGGMSSVWVFELKWRADSAALRQISGYYETLLSRGAHDFVSAVLVAEEFAVTATLPDWLTLQPVRVAVAQSEAA